MAAPVGDDVMGDDPSVNRLQAAVAERAGRRRACSSHPARKATWPR